MYTISGCFEIHHIFRDWPKNAMWNGTSMISHNEVSSTTLSEVTTLETASTTPDAATYIEQHLGVQHLPYNTIIPISVVYAIIFVVGVLGNVLKKSLITL